MARSTRWVSDVARALVTRAVSDDVLTDVLRSAHALSRALETRPSMIADLSNPATPLTDRTTALQKALHGHVHPYLLNACTLLLQQRSFDLVQTFLLRVRREARERGNMEDAQLRTAETCSASTVKELEALATAHQHRTVILHPETDEHLEAGFMIDGMDWSVDGSLRGARERLLSTLLTS